ncbi:hypothetical protein [Clostridium sp.]|uniref:hypothetical protein n=1 Tax=Clostridium sp. TaxID=1506 RepID=UPI0039937555
MHNKEIVITNIILMIIAIILFTMGYKEKRALAENYENSKAKDYYKLIIERGKSKFIIIDTLFAKFIPAIIFLEVIFTYIFGISRVSIVSLIIKILVVIVSGIIYGEFQWNFMNNLYNKNMEAFRSMRFIGYYLIFNGLFFWGVIIATALCYYPHEAFVPAVMQYVAWLFAGLFYGYVDWNKNRLKYANYLKMHKVRAR